MRQVQWDKTVPRVRTKSYAILPLGSIFMLEYLKVYPTSERCVRWGEGGLLLIPRLLQVALLNESNCFQ